MVIRTGTAVTRGGVRAPASGLTRGITGCGGCGMGQYTGTGEELGAATTAGAGWSTWLQQMTAGAMSILGQRYAVPQLEPGVIIQRPGEVVMRQEPGYPVPYAGVAAQVSTGGWVLAAAAVVGVLAVVMLRRKS